MDLTGGPYRPLKRNPRPNCWEANPARPESMRDCGSRRHRDRGVALLAYLGPSTQIDPIGLAGGLNLYGYAGGDPMNFSDPFGLCKKARSDGKRCNHSTGDANLDDPDKRQQMEDSYNNAADSSGGYKYEQGGRCQSNGTCSIYHGSTGLVNIPINVSTLYDWHIHPNVGLPVPGRPGDMFINGVSDTDKLQSKMSVDNIRWYKSPTFNTVSYVIDDRFIHRITISRGGTAYVDSFDRFVKP
jgi:hypothetical protein